MDAKRIKNLRDDWAYDKRTGGPAAHVIYECLDEIERLEGSVNEWYGNAIELHLKTEAAEAKLTASEDNLKAALDDYKIIDDERLSLKAKLQKAKEALSFYANRDSWVEEHIGSMSHPQLWKLIDGDEGKIARKALED